MQTGTSVNQSLCGSYYGTIQYCYTTSECAEHGGTSVSPCAHGKGVCCVVGKSCHNSTKQVQSFFVNPSYPNPDFDGYACDYRIDVTNKSVCRIRLDIENMSLAGPHPTTGACRHDRFLVTPSPSKVFGLPKLCGDNAGQHMYIPVNATGGNASLTLMVMTSGAKSHHWRIRTTQIDCVQQPDNIPPIGCLQYHDGLSGSITSFNYASGIGRYQSNLDYTICIKRSPKTCSIQYRQVHNSVFWINSADGVNLPKGIGRAGTNSCDLYSHDYLYIKDGHGPKEVAVKVDGLVDPQGKFSSSTSDKFCGRSLSGSAAGENAEKLKAGHKLHRPDNVAVITNVTSFASGPFQLRFHSDDMVVPKQEIGFHIMYQQLETGCKWPF